MDEQTPAGAAAGVREGGPGAGARLLLLDGACLERDGVPVAAPLPGMRLLAYLALNGPASRQAAAGVLWPDSTEEHALASLRTAVWRLRGAAGAVLEPDGERLRLGPAVEVDASSFRALARRVLQDGTVQTAAELEQVRSGRGDLLAGWYDDWVLFHRERFRQLRMHLLERVSAQLLGQGEPAAALELALDVVEMEPLRESGHCAVIAVHLAEDNYVEALRQYSAFRRLAEVELGVEPSARMQALVRPPRLLPAPRPAPGRRVPRDDAAPG